MAPPAHIDRLIEDGLTRYGAGDLDGALHLWEQVLTIDPENPQASSYVDYVRLNYEVLQTDAGLGVTTDGGAPFAIEDEPEYIIEITRGEIDPGAAPVYAEPADEGWFIEEEQTHELFARTRSGGRVEPKPEPPKHIEIEADEPPARQVVPPPPRAPSVEVNFDAATREYGNDFLEDPGAFRPEATPGFGSLETAIKKRDLGFVQPTQGPPAAPVPAPFEIRLRTPTGAPPSPAPATPAVSAPTRELEEAGRSATEEDLMLSLPGPRRVTPLRGSQPPPFGSPLDVPLDPGARIPTRELPEQTRPPAAIPVDRAETRQGGPDGDPDDDEVDDPVDDPFDDDLAMSGASTRDLGMRTIGENDFAVNAPTQDLGLRMPDAGRAKPVSKRPPSVFPDEDAPTRQSDVRQIREDHAAHQREALASTRSVTSPGGASDGTRKDIVLPFDPIDARTQQILDAIQSADHEPGGETKEDRTRRRITALIEKATAWSTGGELDKAVAAVDLALSEDADTALAQKLIHRNRDAIMAIFQTFLGNLERQPALARPLHELATAPISPRAAFLLSRIDGTLSIDEILDVSGMPRLEAYRHLCQLFLRGILR